MLFYFIYVPLGEGVGQSGKQQVFLRHFSFGGPLAIRVDEALYRREISALDMRKPSVR